MAFSPSGSKLLVAAPRAVRLWDLQLAREQLAEKKLGWNHPPYAAAPSQHSRLKITLKPRIPPRPEKAGTQQIDLTEHYTSNLSETWDDQTNTLTELTPGLHRFGGIDYDLRGSINLRSAILPDLPARIRAIHIAQRCQKLHFLGGAAYNPVHGETAATIRISYADGTQHDIPVVVGRDVGNWWFRETDQAGSLDVAWTGNNLAADQNGYDIRLLHWSWSNPRPQERIETLDLISTYNQGAFFLVAITAE